MPIHPRHRGLYPFDWRQLSASIRFRRADSRRGARARAEDLCFFRPDLDADALVAVVEMIVAGHLVDLALGTVTNLR